MDRYYKESDIREYLEGKAEHYKKRIKRIKGYGKKISYNPKEQIEGWQDEVAIYESMIRELAENVSTIEASEDCISREWVGKNMLKYGFLAPDMTVTEFVADAPRVIAERSSEAGEWKWESEDVCDKCGYEIPHLERIIGETVLMDSRDWKYCPNCGKKKGKRNGQVL